MNRKNFFLILIACLSIIIFTHTTEATIYISEVRNDEGKNQTATLLSVFRDDGTPIREITLPGTIVRVSPDQKYIAYVGMANDKATSTQWDVVITDMQKTKVGVVPFKAPRQHWARSVVGMEWSPRGSKLLILLAGSIIDNTDNTYPVDVIVYDLASNAYKKIARLRADSPDEAFFVQTGWFPDNRSVWTRELAARNGGAVKIIDTETLSSYSVYEGMAIVQPSRDGRELFLITPEHQSSSKDAKSKANATNAKLTRYDVQTRKTLALGGVPNYPPAFLLNSSMLSANGDYLFLPRIYGQTKNLLEFQIASQKLVEKQTPDLSFIPKVASPHDNHLVCGFDMQEREGYGLMNYKTMQYKKIKGFSEKAPSGEGAWGSLLLNRIDWF